MADQTLRCPMLGTSLGESGASTTCLGRSPNTFPPHPRQHRGVNVNHPQQPRSWGDGQAAGRRSLSFKAKREPRQRRPVHPWGHVAEEEDGQLCHGASSSGTATSCSALSRGALGFLGTGHAIAVLLLASLALPFFFLKGSFNSLRKHLLPPLLTHPLGTAASQDRTPRRG